MAKTKIVVEIKTLVQEFEKILIKEAIRKLLELRYVPEVIEISEA